MYFVADLSLVAVIAESLFIFTLGLSCIRGEVGREEVVALCAYSEEGVGVEGSMGRGRGRLCVGWLWGHGSGFVDTPVAGWWGHASWGQGGSHAGGGQR